MHEGSWPVNPFTLASTAQKAIAYGALAAAALFAVVAGVQTVRLAASQAQYSDLNATFAGHVAADQAAVTAASETYRREEKRRAAAQKESDDAAHAQLASAQADASAAGRALQRLRQRVAADSAGRGAAADDPAAVPERPAASSPSDLQADVLGGLGAAAGQLAAYGDAARIAGQACEREHDSLTRQAAE